MRAVEAQLVIGVTAGVHMMHGFDGLLLSGRLRKVADMTKIKIVSNPYNRSLSYYIFKPQLNTWEDIKQDSINSRLREDDEEKSTSLCTVDISAPYFFMENKALLEREDLIPLFPSLTSHGVASRLASSKNGLPVALESIMQFSTMRFDYNGFYSCSATIVISDTSAAHDGDVFVDFALNRPYVFERSRYIRNSDGGAYEVPIIVGEIVDPNYLV